MTGSPSRGGPPVPGLDRILALRLDNIGDVIMLGPALRAVKAIFPTSCLTLLTSPAGAQAAELLPWVDEVIEWRAIWQEVGDRRFDPERERDLIEQLRTGAHDAALIFTSFSQSPHPAAVACLLAGIPLRVGASHDAGQGILTHALPAAEDELHQVERNLRLIEGIGIPRGDETLKVRITEQAAAEAAGLLDGQGLEGGDYVLVAPWASAPARSYPVERWAEACRLTANESGLRVLVVGGTKDRSRSRPLLAALGASAADLVGRSSLPALAALVERAAAVLCNNSLPLHLADATGRPLVVAYSGTDLESQWRPRSVPARLLRRLTWCSPCYQIDCPFAIECLDIPPRELAAACLDLLTDAGEFGTLRGRERGAKHD
jgi:ADP-heptose:LPS heptosyltransferase